MLGFVITAALYFLAGLGFAAFDVLTGQPIPDVPPISFFESALLIAGLQVYGGVPLIIGFLCAHVLARFARSRLGRDVQA